MAHPVNRLVYARFFFDVGIAARDIGLGLIIIIIRNEIFDCIVGEKAFEFAVKLRCQNFVGGKDKRRALQFFDDLRDGKGFT